jgi:predicted DNA-binding protein
MDKAEKTKSIQSGLDFNNYELLELLAKNKGLSISMFVRFIILEYLESKKDILKELK